MANNEMKFLITGDASAGLGALNQFSGAVKGAAGQIEGHFNGLSKVIDNFAAPVLKITALMGGGVMFKGAIDGAVGFAKEVGGLQRIMGGTSQEASATALAVRSIFGDTETYESAASKLVKTLNKNESAITSLGIKTRDSKGHFRAMTDLLPEVVQAMGQYAAGTDRDAVAQTIFGRSFQEMLKFASMTPEVMEEARKKSRELGLELDSQSQGTIKAYRRSMVDVDEAFLGLKTRVALQVMPSLTDLAHWFSNVAPGAIKATGGALGSVQEALSLTSVKLAITGLAINSFLGSRLWAGVIASFMKFNATLNAGTIPALDVMGLKMASTATRGGNLMTAIGGLVNPWVLVGAAIAGAAIGLEYWTRASSRTAQAHLDEAKKLEGLHSEYDRLTTRLLELDKIHKDSKTSTEAKTKAAAEEKTIIAELCTIYPGFAKFLFDEHGARRDISEVIRLQNKDRLDSAMHTLAEAEAHTANAKALIAELQANIEYHDRMRHLNNAMGAGSGGGFVLTASVDSMRLEDAKKALQEEEAATNLARKNLESLQAKDTNQHSGKHFEGGGSKAKKDLVTHEEAALAIEKARVDAMAEINLQEQQAKEEAKANLEYSRAAEKLDADRAAGKYKRSGGNEDYLAEMNAVRAANIAKLETIKTDYAEKRRALEEDLQGKLTAAEEGGLEKRLEAIRKNFVKIREENKKLALDGKRAYSDDVIQAAEDASAAQAKKDQTQADLAKLKTELSELAQVKGGKLSDQDTQEVLGRWKKQGGTKADAAAQYGRDNHLGESGGAGFQAGLNAFAAKSQNVFSTWKDFSLGVLNSAESGFSNFFTSLTQKGQTFGEKTKALWKSISGSVVQGLSQIAAQHLINWGIEKGKLAWDKIRQAFSTADVSKTVTENSVKSASNTGTAATGFFASFAALGPWGFAAAAAAIVAMFAILGSLQGRERGGPVTAGTPYIVGEAGHELFVPEVSGTIIPHHVLTNAGGNLASNISRHDSRMSRLQAQAGGYATTAISSGGGAMGRGINLHNPLFITKDSREAQKMIRDMAVGYDRREK